MPIKFPAVIPTDTIYGLVGRALKPAEVAAVYRLKQRSPRQPSIVLISRIAELAKFGIKLSRDQKQILQKLWPGPISIIIEGQAFRLPAKRSLRKLLKQTGPLVAPSANPSGQPPARTIAQAKKYFGDKIKTYLDGGRFAGQPSSLIKLDFWR